MSVTTLKMTETKNQHERDATAYALGVTPVIYDNFKMAEDLAHRLAYEKLKTNDQVEICIAGLSQNIQHKVYKFKVNHKGLVGYILCPIEFSKNQENKFEIKIIFKGTSDLHSLQRNKETGAPGHESFYDNKQAMIAQLNGIIKSCKLTLSKKGINVEHLDFVLTIAGHSLGGGDAQRFMLAVKEAVAQNLNIPQTIVKLEEGIEVKARDELNSIRKIVLYTFNSVGITNDDNQKAEQLSGFLTHKQKQSLSKLSLEVNIFYAAGDGIQQIADTHLLHRVSKDNASVRLLKATSNLEGLHFINKKEAKALLFKVGQTVAKNVVGKGIVAGAVCVGAAYAVGLTSLVGGGAALLSGGWTLKNWYKTGRMVYSLAAGGYGMLVAHQTFYFTDTFESISKKKLDHYFLVSENDHATGQTYIMGEVQNKSSAFNCLHQTYAKTTKQLSKPFRLCGRKPAATKEKDFEIVGWQYNPQVVELKQHQEQVQIKAQQVAQARAQEQHQQLVLKARRKGLL